MINHILNLKEQIKELEEVFRTLREGHSISLLGAGASVSDHIYLGKHLIDYYQSIIGKQLGTDNIVEFVDILSNDPSFNRLNFDMEVAGWLRRISHNKAHLTFLSIPWYSVVTTNFDLLIEHAYDQLTRENRAEYELKAIRSITEANYSGDRTQLLYYKLNGCISSLDKYHLVFSNKDFELQKKCYKQVLSRLKEMSPRINFISFGYSYSDPFASEILGRFEKFDYRLKKRLWAVDPFINLDRLPFYTSKNICVIKLSFQEFMEQYDNWRNENALGIIKRSKIKILDTNNKAVQIKPVTLVKLKDFIEPLQEDARRAFITGKQFYLGESPNYGVILNNFDVVHDNNIVTAKRELNRFLKASISNLIPIISIVGNFGNGKSTHTFRLLNQLLTIDMPDSIGLQITNYDNFPIQALEELVKNAEAKNVFIYADDIEVDSNFKNLLHLRGQLSSAQLVEKNIFIFTSIRQNILERHKKSHSIANSLEISFDSILKEEELTDLLKKLANEGIVNYYDTNNLQNEAKRILQAYGGDSFLSLMDLVTRGEHKRYLLSAVDQLSKEMQNALLYTACLHRFKLLMPAGVLRQLITGDWNTFKQNIIDVEGKGLLVQKVNNSTDLAPDLYFNTTHPALADLLVNELIPKKRLFGYYDKIVGAFPPTSYASKLLINLFKAIKKEELLTFDSFSQLLDKAASILSDESYFLLFYATHLQHKGGEAALMLASDNLIYAEGLLEKRNTRFTHRRAVINFELAKFYFELNRSQSNLIDSYFFEAEELFKIKRTLDPFSSYSHSDFLRMKIWLFENYYSDESYLIEAENDIHESYDYALRTVKDNIDRITNIYSRFRSKSMLGLNDKEFEEKYIEMMEEPRFRPYAIMIKVSRDENRERLDYLALNNALDELNFYKSDRNVVSFIFKILGRRLHIPNYRVMFFNIIKNNSFLVEEEQLRYLFFSSIAEAYNRLFHNSFQHTKEILSSFSYVNPDYSLPWMDSETNEVATFEAIAKKKSNDKFVADVPELRFDFPFLKESIRRKPFKENDRIKISLHFTLFGIKAKIK